MANVLDNEVVLESAQGVIIWRNFTTQVDFLKLFFSATNPNGVLTAPAGSLVSGASGTWQNTSGGTVWVLLSTSAAAAFLAPDEYYIDSSQLSQPALRIYPSVEDAVTAAEVEQTGPYLLRLRQAQFHLWGGSGLPVGSTREITIFGETLSTTLEISGVFPVAAAGATLRLQNLAATVGGGGSLDLGINRRLLLESVSFDGADQAVILEGPGVSAVDSNIQATRFLGAGAGAAAASFTRCGVTYNDPLVGPFLSLIATFFVDTSSFDLSRTNGTFLVTGGLPGVSGTIENSTFRVKQNGVGTLTMFTVGAGGLIFTGATFTWLPGGGTIDFGLGAALAGSARGINSFGTDPANLPTGSWHDVAGDVVVM